MVKINKTGKMCQTLENHRAVPLLWVHVLFLSCKEKKRHPNGWRFFFGTSVHNGFKGNHTDGTGKERCPFSAGIMQTVPADTHILLLPFLRRG